MQSSMAPETTAVNKIKIPSFTLYNVHITSIYLVRIMQSFKYSLHPLI